MGIRRPVSAPRPAYPTVAVTGASGYLGTAVAGHFHGRGWRVLRLVRDRGTAADNVEFALGQAVSAEFWQGVRLLVHCAYDFSLSRREDITRVNVDGSAALFASARGAGVATQIYVSSISAFDGCASVYGRTKLQIEAAARACGAVVLRPGLIFGEPPGGTFGRLIQQVSKSRIIPLIGDGSQVQYLVNRDDLAELIVRIGLGEVQRPDVPVTVAHPRPWLFRELLLAIAGRMGRRPLLVPTPWRAVWASLRVAELLHVPLDFKSDSVVSLMHQNPAPDFTAMAAVGALCRPFS